jgi:hypothetical protein
MPTRAVSYEVVETANDGHFKAIVVPPEHLNDTDMALLAEEFHGEKRGDSRGLIVMMFTDKSIVPLRHRLESLSAAEEAAYDKAFLGTYNRNPATGFERFHICYDGFVDGTDCYTKTY